MQTNPHDRRLNPYQGLNNEVVQDAHPRREQEKHEAVEAQSQSAASVPCAGSPTRIHSPLRQSVSFDEPLDLTIPTLRTEHLLDISESSSKSPKMSLTGDRRQSGRSWHTRRASSHINTVSDITPSHTPRLRSESTTPKQASPTSNYRFSFLNALRGAPLPTVMPSDEELLSMDVDKALFPSGAPSDRDSFSPAAFKNLHMTAAGLLRKFQGAYSHKVEYVRELQEGNQMHQDGNDEAETRIQHLKMQLERMARKAAEQETTMKALMEALNHEKKMRMEEGECQEKNCLPSSASTLSEDLCVEEDQKEMARRRSTATFKSDLSFDTDEESAEEMSIFSRCRSPTAATAMSDLSWADATPPGLHKLAACAVQPRPQRPAPVTPQLSAFQKIWKGVSSPDAVPRASKGCTNCQGQDASIAWDTVSLLRDENKALKHSIGVLEDAVEGALDAVNGIDLNVR